MINQTILTGNLGADPEIFYTSDGEPIATFAIIVCHNHPSGELVPSDADMELTKQLVAAGELLGIKVLDHLIVSNRGYKSLRDYHEYPN